MRRAVRGDPAGQDLDVDDDQRDGGHAARALHRGRPKRAAYRAQEIRGTIQNDILKEYIARGTYIYPPRPSLRLITRHLRVRRPRGAAKWNTISISGYHMREAGCDAVQEVAFTLADGIAYVEAAVDAGLDVDGFGARLSLLLQRATTTSSKRSRSFARPAACGRAIMGERFGAKTDRARALRFHCQTAGMTLTAQQPMINVVRVAVQALAAVLGGCQSLHTNGFDEALGLPTAEAATLALRTQQVIAYESGVADFVDPLGGSYAIESADRRESKTARSRYIERIDDLGGMVAAIEQGYVQREIQASGLSLPARDRGQEARHRRPKRVRQRGGAGPGDEDRSPPRREQKARVRAWRAQHEGLARSEALGRIDAAAKGKDNLLPPILEAREGRRDGGRDQRRAPRRVGRACRDAHHLTHKDRSCRPLTKGPISALNGGIGTSPPQGLVFASEARWRAACLVLGQSACGRLPPHPSGGRSLTKATVSRTPADGPIERAFPFCESACDGSPPPSGCGRSHFSSLTTRSSRARRGEEPPPFACSWVTRSARRRAGIPPSMCSSR